jgi:hypothetical protein
MAPKRRGRAAKAERGNSASRRSRSAELIVADPAWVDIAQSGLKADHAVPPAGTPAHFVEDIVRVKSWAAGVDDSVRRAIASAISWQCAPWHIEYEQYRSHVADWAKRVASFLRSVIPPLTEDAKKVRELEAELRQLRDRVSRLEGLMESGRDDSSHVLPGESIPEAIHRAQMRAARSRSPGPHPHIGPDGPGWPPNPHGDVVYAPRAASLPPPRAGAA